MRNSRMQRLIERPLPGHNQATPGSSELRESDTMAGFARATAVVCLMGRADASCCLNFDTVFVVRCSRLHSIRLTSPADTR